MNYNRGCYKHPTANNYRNRENIADFNRIYPQNMQKEGYDTANTTEMNYKLAMVYSPYQEWQNIYCGEKALENGTIFAELDKPFWGYKCTKGVCSL